MTQSSQPEAQGEPERVWLCICTKNGEQMAGHRFDCPVRLSPIGSRFTTDPKRATETSHDR